MVSGGLDQLQLRRAQADELRCCSELEARVTAHPWSLNQFLQSSLREQDAIWVLVHPDQGILAFCIIQRVLDEATLMNIAVEPGWQGSGLATRLLEAVLRQLAQQGCRRCLLEVRRGNLPAQALYRKLGFVDDGVRKGYYPAESEKEDALLMSLCLEADA